MIRRSSILGIAVAAALCVTAPAAFALPALQIYSPDATYDYALETWVITDDTFELWVVGDVGGHGSIYDVTLAASCYGTGSLTFNGGTLPIDTDYADKEGFKNGVQNHAEFANADSHEFYDIGDFTSTADIIQDYQPGADPATGTGEIKKYTVHVTGFDAVHFDAFDHYYTGRPGTASYQLHGVFAPFSHDATGGGGEGGSGGSGGGGGTSVPEPGSMFLIGGGALAIALTNRRKK